MGIFNPKKNPLAHIGRIDVVKSFKTIRIHLVGLDTSSKDWAKKAGTVQEAVKQVLRREPALKAAKAKVSLNRDLNEIQIDMWKSKSELFEMAAAIAHEFLNNTLSVRQEELLRFVDFEELDYQRVTLDNEKHIRFELPVMAAINVMQGEAALAELQDTVTTLLQKHLPEAKTTYLDTDLQPVLQIDIPWDKESGSALDMRKKLAHMLGIDLLNHRPHKN